MDKNFEEYKKYVSDKLSALTPVFAKASIGDFSEKIEVPEGDDEFTQLYAGIIIMLEVIQHQLTELNTLNKTLSENVEELQFTRDRIEEERIFDEAIIESLGDGVIVTDKDLIITMVNYQAQLMLGFTKDEFISKPMDKLLRAVDDKNQPIPENQRSTKIALSQKRKHSVNYFFLKQDNTPLAVSVTSSPLLVGGITSGAIIVFKDRTKDRQIEELKNEFISLAAHQLRSPLGIMRWNMELIQKQISSTDPTTPKIQSVYGNILKMIALVNDMLSVSKIDQGKVEHVIEAVDLVSVVEDLIKDIQPIAENKMVNINFNKPSAPTSMISADKKKIRDVIQNILNNSLKFNIPLGKIEVSIKQISDRVTLEISDTGIGIPPADQDQVFDKFFRATNAILGQTPGTGLGLFLVKSYVENWNGKVWFESPANERFRSQIGRMDNLGTSFYVEFKTFGGDKK